MATFTLSTAHSIGTTDQTQLTQTSMETVLKTTSIGMMITTVFLTFTIQMTVIAVLLIMTQMIILQTHTTLLQTVAHSMVAKTAHLTQTTQPTTGTSSFGTILSPTLFLITTAMMLQQLQLRQGQFQNTTGSCLLAGHLTTAETTGILTQMEILSPTDSILTKMPTECPIGGTKTKVTTECSIPMT